MKTVVIIFIISLIQMQSIEAQESIDVRMQSQIASSHLKQDDNFNIPKAGYLNQTESKSSFKAALYSLILPGAGHYYINQINRAKLHFGIESGLWVSYYGFRKYGAYMDNAAKGWAVVKAGANPNNTDELYWVKMTYYDNRDRNEGVNAFGYNQMAAVFDREEAVLFPETPLYYWNWDSYDDRQKYRQLRNKSKNAYERSKIIIGGVIGNHIVSAISAYFSAIKYNRQQEFSDTGLRLNYSFKPDYDNPSIKVTLSRYFN